MVGKQQWVTIVLCGLLAGMSSCGSPESNVAVDRTGERWDGGSPGHDSGPRPFEDGPDPLPDAGSVVPLQPIEEVPREGECGASSFEAQQVVVQREVQVESQVTVVKPVALYIMFDQSWSMKMGGANLWDPAVAAIKSFANDADSKGLGVGLQFFPINGGACNGTGYKTPAVAVGALPAQASKLAQSLDAHDPSGNIGTPIEGALRGSTEFCKQYQKDRPAEQCVAVVVTDGKPEYDNCEKNGDTLAGIAKAAHDAGVTTFAVGLSGADFTLLDKIAKAGGAPDCEPASASYACNVSSGAMKLADALSSIRDTVVKTEIQTIIETHVEESKLPCEWAIPAQPEGQTLDRDKVNVRLTSGDQKTTFVRVGAASSRSSKLSRKSE